MAYRQTSALLLVILISPNPSPGNVGRHVEELPGQPAKEEVGGPEGGQVHRSKLRIPAPILEVKENITSNNLIRLSDFCLLN
jgi:hypothetical protein